MRLVDRRGVDRPAPAMSEEQLFPGRTAAVVRVVDLAATLVLAIDGALAAVRAGLDPIGIIAIAFLSALGGGIARDLLIGQRPAAVQDRTYAVLVLVAGAIVWSFDPFVEAVPGTLLMVIDAAGLSLAAVAGTDKAREFGVDRLTAVFIGGVAGVGGGTVREIVLNRVPPVLSVNFYATAALAAGLVVVVARSLGLSPRVGALVAVLVCFALRVAGASLGWQLPHLPRG